MFRKLVGNSSIIFLGTVVASIFSYLFNMLMGRMLGPEAYGEMSALMSLLMIVAVGGGAMMTVSMRYSGELYSSNNNRALKRLFLKFTQYVLLFSAILLLIGASFSKIIMGFFHISEIIPILITLSVIVPTFVIMINKGILQGAQKFIPVSFLGVSEMFLRFSAGVLLVKIGLGLSGAVSALVLSTAIAYILSLLLVKPLFKSKSPEKKKGFKFDRNEIIKYSLPTLLVSIVLATSINLDIILIKHYFNSEDAGLYAAVSTVAKIIFYLLSPIASVMFPMVSEQKIKRKKHYKILLYSILLTFFGGLIIIGLYNIIPGTIVKILYGSNYLSYYYLLPEIGLAILFFTLINLISNYYMAVKDFTFLWINVIFIIFQTLFIVFWHPSILGVVRIFIISQGLIFTSIFGYYLLTKRKQIIKYINSGQYLK